MSSSNDQPKVSDERKTRSESLLPSINTNAERSMDNSKQNVDHPSDEFILKKIEKIHKSISEEQPLDSSKIIESIPFLVEQILKNNNEEVKIKVFKWICFII